MGYPDFFSEETVVCGLRAADRDGCFREMLGALVAAKRLTPQESELALEALRNREKVGTTGIGGEVAIPHAKIAGMGRVAAVLATHRDGLDFGSIDGAPVKVVFLIVRPAGEDQEHLRFLQWVSRMGRNGDFRRCVVNAGDKSEILALLREMSGI